MAKSNDLWISCNMQVMDPNKFLSDHAHMFMPDQSSGIDLEFISEFIKAFSAESIGLDISHVMLESDTTEP